MVGKGQLRKMLEDTSFMEDIDFGVKNFEILYNNKTSFFVNEQWMESNAGDKSKIMVDPETYLAPFPLSKCFSFFTNLKITENNITLMMNKYSSFEIEIHNANLLIDDYESDHQSRLFFTMIANRDIPKLMEMTLINAYQTHVIKTQAIEIKSLESPYKTMCQKYSNNPFIQSFTKCMARCIFDYLNPNFTTSEMFVHPDNQYLVTSNWIEEGQKFTKDFSGINFSLRKTKIESELLCEKRCPVDCDQTFYQLSTSRTTQTQFPDSTFIVASHNSLNIIIVHHPETSFLSYVGTVGGLAGIWLGFSFFNTFGSMLYTIKSIQRKITSKIRLLFEKRRQMNN